MALKGHWHMHWFANAMALKGHCICSRKHNLCLREQMQWPFRAIAFANQCEHTSGPLGPLVCELSACKRPFRAFYMRCVCFCPLGQKHTRSTRNLPFRANCVCIWCTSGPKGPLVHVNKYYNAHTRLLLMAISGHKMASKMEAI